MISEIRAPEAASGDTVQNGQPPANSVIVLAPESGSLPGDIPTEDILVSISRIAPVEDGLLVPTRAIVAGPDGSTTVLRQASDGTFQDVPITQIACVTGRCAIRSEDLSPGDRVRVDVQ